MVDLSRKTDLTGVTTLTSASVMGSAKPNTELLGQRPRFRISLTVKMVPAMSDKHIGSAGAHTLVNGGVVRT
jgi:hypothetical protein